MAQQQNPVASTNANERKFDPSSYSSPLIQTLPFENIGPTVFSGRVSDIAVNPKDPSIFYVAYASGGLWKTENHGTTFTPLFDKEEVMTIGDIAVDWEKNIIVVGTGEVNSSRSSYAGNGVYISKDGGQSWSHKGLEESHHIGRVILHPDNPDQIYVAALGHLYSSNEERGVFKSNDGGVNWSKVLFVNENAGAVDLVAHPDNPDILYAAIWERTRRAWDFQESGLGSGIYKTEDGGMNWMKISGNGFPESEGTGRIGLDVHYQNGETTLYAILDNYDRRPKETSNKEELTKDQLKEMDAEKFAKLSDKKIQKFLSDNYIPEEYTVEKIREKIKAGSLTTSQLASYNKSANTLLFDTPVIGAEVYVTKNDGTSWTKTHDDYINGLYNSYGYYFGQIRVAPYDANEVYIMGVPILRSKDGGATWENVNGKNVHVDHHALWINPERPGHLINGNDGGINISYDHGDTWTKHNSPSVGQFYYINVDMNDPYNVFGGTQDNGVWKGSKNYNDGFAWQMRGSYPYKTIMGGDGMQIQIDNRDNATIYTGFQFGNYFRINANGGRNYITPKHELGEQPYRWNWQSPILLSPHNQDILYMGSNFLHRSMDKGENFIKISKDLTKGGIKGDVAYGTLTTIDESVLDFGVIYTGSDDGLVHITKDGGKSWTLISKDLPQDMWVSRVQASKFDSSRVYVSLNGYRWDHFNAYVYMSEDYGQSWQSLASGLPAQPVNVIKEDPFNEDILYVGTDNGVYISSTKGQSWHRFGDLPNVPVHDLVIHPRDGDLIIGTHGRSIYVADANMIRSIVNQPDAELLIVNEPTVDWDENWGSSRSIYAKKRVPKIKVNLFSVKDDILTLEVLKDNKVLYSEEYRMITGLNFIIYEGNVSEKALKVFKDEKPKMAKDGRYYLPPGEYKIKCTLDGVSDETILKVEDQ